MKKSVFGKFYAQSYDSIYQNKDYRAECLRLERVFTGYAKAPVKTVLDLGCGTANHLLLLAQMGYRITGVDLSAHMLRCARRKAAFLPTIHEPAFVKSDIRNLKLKKRFDAALMMFAVLGYQKENHDVLRSLRSVRRHLRRGGIFVFDVWHGPAVLRTGPERKTKSVMVNKIRMRRVAFGTLDTSHNLCQVGISLFESGSKRKKVIHETHWMRYFFPKELELFLELAGFSLIRASDFLDFKSPASERTWNAVYIARAV